MSGGAGDKQCVSGGILGGFEGVGGKQWVCEGVGGKQ